MSEKQQNLQDTFLNAVRKSKSPVTIFLVNGVKLQGNITWFDNFCVLLRRDGQAQLVYKHAISTVMPMGPIQLRTGSGRTNPPALKREQDASRRVRRTAFVIHVEPKSRERDALDRDADARLAEAVGLTAAHRLDVIAEPWSRRWRRPCPRP